MVAYSFQKRFASRILDGSKRQTIRRDHRRHARPGEMLQLYTGMRSTSCRKIISDQLCISVEPIQIDFTAAGSVLRIEIGGVAVDDIQGFVMADGFDSLADMGAFWTAAHGFSPIFRGVLIRWIPLVAAS